GPAPPAPGAKTTGDFLRALGRRVWLVLLVAVAVILPGAVFIMRQPAIYRTSAEIRIEPPKVDPTLASIIANTGIGAPDREANDKYVPTHLAILRNSKELASRVVADREVGPPPPGVDDPIAELQGGLSVRPYPNTNFFEVNLEGPDPARVYRLLRSLLRHFEEQTHNDSIKTAEQSKVLAQQSLSALQQEIAKIDKSIYDLIKSSNIFAPGGKNLVEEEYSMLKSVLLQKRLRFDDLVQEERIARFYPNHKGPAAPSPREMKIAKLLEQKEYWEEQALKLKGMARNFNGDPAARYITQRLDRVLVELEKLERATGPQPPDLTRMMLSHSAEEIRQIEQKVGETLEKMQESMADYQKYLTLLKDREDKASEITATNKRLAQFTFLAQTQKPPVTILREPTEPTAPVRPKRATNLALVVVLGLGLGVGLVCLLEYFDRSVKVPEHLTAGLTLPLLGVVPRMRRLARIHRGGHLWTPGAPESLEADAYRNVRASLLGLSGPRGPLVTLLVTSAKMGEGKSTTALNLAATCARAGERTLLVDCDLRRPSLAEVFAAEEDEGEGPHPGLADVLRDELPWQRAVTRTDIPNLDFLPAGDPTGVPIEVLGSLELRQLITALASHYHRVILDGPAVLGLADGRMLGRVADATILVVRSGVHELRPLRRAKEMLEQSRVPIAGVVFNGLIDDLQNWSSYGPNTAYGYSLDDGQAATRSRGLEALPETAAATAAAGIPED
ncbi:MAG: polysaccharide biosynthesis tyrosine autokinase, partial [Isosphaeraceae bacterium]|nr:polysaccharide biosynthesis tyrosine autokinase [Isosphaeraceae bacterium]